MPAQSLNNTLRCIILNLQVKKMKPLTRHSPFSKMTQCIATGTPAWPPNSTHWSPNHSPAVYHVTLLFPPLGTAAHSYLFLHVLKPTENQKIMKRSVIQDEVSLSPFLYPPAKASEREPFGYLFLTFRFFPYSGLGI